MKPMKSSAVPARWPGRPTSTAPSAAASPSPLAPRPFAPSPAPPTPGAGAASGAPIQRGKKTDSVKKSLAKTEERLKRARERDRMRLISKPVFKKKKIVGHKYVGGGTGGPLAASGIRAIRAFEKNKTKTRFDTHFGPVNLSKFPTKDPGAKITTVKKDYGASVGHKYTHLVDAFGSKSKKQDQNIAAELLRASTQKKFKPKHLTTGAQKNAAAKLLAIANISERRRVEGSGKAFRGTLRMVKSGEIRLKDAFTGDNPTFPMAKNPTYMRRVVNYDNKKLRKKPPKPKKFDKLADYLSDSSDEED